MSEVPKQPNHLAAGQRSYHHTGSEKPAQTYRRCSTISRRVVSSVDQALPAQLNQPKECAARRLSLAFAGVGQFASIGSQPLMKEKLE